MKFKSTLVGLFALVLVAGAAVLTYYSFTSKQGEAGQPSTVTQAVDTAYKTTPIFVKQNPVNNLLFNGENELFSFTLGTNLNKSIAFKQIVLKIQKSADVKLSNFRLFKNSKALPTQDYNIMEATTGLDLKSSLGSSTDPYAIVAVSFNTEEVIYGSGNTYSIKAVSQSDLMKKSYVMTSVYRIENNEMVKGYLTNIVAQPFTAASQGIYSVKNAANSGSAAPGLFIWSDMSSSVHTPSVAKLSSNDWINDYDDGSLDSPPTSIVSK